MAVRQGFVPIPGRPQANRDATLIGLAAMNEAQGE
jgi:hypothetical protein